MNQTKFQEALGEIDERFIAEAHEPRAVRKRSVRILRRGLLAAAVLVALALSLFAYGSGRWYSIVLRTLYSFPLQRKVSSTSGAVSGFAYLDRSMDGSRFGPLACP